MRSYKCELSYKELKYIFRLIPGVLLDFTVAGSNEITADLEATFDFLGQLKNKTIYKIRSIFRIKLIWGKDKYR